MGIISVLVDLVTLSGLFMSLNFRLLLQSMINTSNATQPAIHLSKLGTHSLTTVCNIIYVSYNTVCGWCKHIQVIE